MDKSWIGLRNRTSKPYKDGVAAFLNYAFRDKNTAVDAIYCPCSKCRNRYFHGLEMVKMHIEMDGFDKTYLLWNRHGENFVSELNRDSHNSRVNMLDDTTTFEADVTTNMVSLIQEGMGFPPPSSDHPTNDEGIGNDDVAVGDAFEEVTGSNEDAAKFYRRLKEAESELYENCPMGVTELSFVVELLTIKQVNNMTNAGITQILNFLRKIFPFAKIPKSYYLANKLTTDLGFNFKTVDACPNSCMLFHKEAANLENCEICDAPRYKSIVESSSGTGGGNQGTSVDATGKRVAWKQARYWSVKKKLQRLFWCSHTAPLMKWHKERNTNAPRGFKPICYQKLNKAWKAFKFQVKKKYFKPFEGNPGRLAVVPPDVVPDQWPILVKYWSMESTKKVADRNFENRKNLNAYPRIGRRSIATIVAKRKKNKLPTDRVSVWRATRGKDGTYTEEDGAAGVNEQLQRRLDELQEEEKDDPEKLESIFIEVVGNDGHGRVLCGGNGTENGSSYGATSTETSQGFDANAYEAELAKLREECAKSREDLAILREERDRHDAERDAEIASLRALVQVNQQSSMDAEARVLRLLQSAGLTTNLVLASNPSPGLSSGRGSNSRNDSSLS